MDEARTIGGEGARTLLHAPPSARTEPPGAASETARYFDLPQGQIYTVTHAAQSPRRGAVLLCGPFGVERERAYLTLVTWARALAASGFEVMRFDYRGTGESTGAFQEMTLARWREDASFCAARLSAATQGGALVLQGVRLGALLAAELFAFGVGDGLLLWAPPESAEALLRETLRHNLITQCMAEPGAPRRTREQLIAALERGEPVEVDGYPWTQALWRDAQRHRLVLPAAGESRPWHALQPQGAAAAAAAAEKAAGVATASVPSAPSRPESVDADTFWSSSSNLLVPRCAGFFRASLRWLDAHEPWQARGA